MMQTLKHLEVPIAGQKFLKDSKEKWNPLGFYEVPYVVFDGVRELGEYGGKAIKLISQALVRTRKDIIWKSILCLRCPFEIRQSNAKIGEGRDVSAHTYIMFLSRILEIMLSQPAEKWLVVDFEDMLYEPEKEVSRIAEFLGVPVQESAIQNVNKSMHLSLGDCYFDDSDEIIETALDLYKTLHNPWEAPSSMIEKLLSWTKAEVCC